MNVFVLLVAAVPALLFCLLRYERYQMSFAQMLGVWSSFILSGMLGAVLVQFLMNGSLAGKRLYGLMLADTLLLLLGSRLFKKNICELGDYISVPTMAGCCFSKLDCLRDGCCYGLVLYQPEMQQPVRFPSAVVEMTLWAGIVIVLLVLENKQRMKGKLWPLAMIWFGFFRYVTDFLRGSPLEKEVFLLHMPGGQFWSLIVLLLGVALLYATMRYQLKRPVRIREFLRNIVGLDEKVEM